MREEFEEEKKGSKLLTVAIVFLGLVLMLILLFIGAWFLFEVENVKVEGNALYEDELIKEQVLNDEYSWNALYVFLKYKIKDTESIPFIDTMKVRLAGRNTIVITVYEKEMIGYTYVESTGQYAYIDKDGIVVEKSTNQIQGVPCIESLDVTEVNLYEKLQVKDDSVFKELLSLTNSLEKYDLVPELVIIQDLGNFQLSYGDIAVNFGKAKDVNDKVVRLEKIMPSLEGLTGVLHMEDWESEESDITFEKLDAPEDL